MSSRVLAVAGWSLAATGAVWAGLWIARLRLHLEAGGHGLAREIPSTILFALLPVAALWTGAVIALVRSRQRRRREAAAELETRLVEAVRTRGTVRLAALAREWRLPEARLWEVVEELEGLHLLPCVVDRARGELLMPFARLDAPCPHCGGPLEPAGAGLLACRYCGSRFPVRTDRGEPPA